MFTRLIMNISEKEFQHYSINQLLNILQYPEDHTNKAIQNAFIILSKKQESLDDIDLKKIKPYFKITQLKNQFLIVRLIIGLFQFVCALFILFNLNHIEPLHSFFMIIISLLSILGGAMLIFNKPIGINISIVNLALQIVTVGSLDFIYRYYLGAYIGIEFYQGGNFSLTWLFGNALRIGTPILNDLIIGINLIPLLVIYILLWLRKNQFYLKLIQLHLS